MSLRNLCSRCKLTSPDGNLWCQEVDCPAGALPLLLQYGDMLGNLKILEGRRVLRSAVIYRAERGIENEIETFFLKVANPGTANETYLKREAETLRAITGRGKSHPTIPIWKPHGAVNGDDAFGIITFHEQPRLFFLMDNAEGEFLGDVLLDNPQPWHEHIGWFLTALSEGVIELQKASRTLHANLNPDAILVGRNGANVPVPLLLDMGLGVAPGATFPASELETLRAHLAPAYTAPAFLTGEPVSPSVDVYGLGLLLYEMLAGHPAFTYTLRRTEDIYADIITVKPQLQREDVPAAPTRKGGTGDDLNAVVERSIARDSAGRYTDVTQFRQALYTIYGDAEDRRRTDWNSITQNIGKYIVAGAIGFFILFVVITLISALLSPALAPA